MNEATVLNIQIDARAVIATIMCHEFDHKMTNQFKAETATAVDGALPMVLDLANVGYMPSLTLGALVELRNRFARERRQLTLVGMQPQIIKLMQAAGMLSLFTVCNTVADALQAGDRPSAAEGSKSN